MSDKRLENIDGEDFAMLADVITPVAPPPSLKGRLMERVAAYEELRPLADVRRNEGTWHRAFPGVDVRHLFRDPATGQSTDIIRMAPGASFPPHAHGANEQCLVLEGDISWGAISYHAGDFIAMAKDSVHPRVSSEHGNLLLIISGDNEYARV